MTYSSIGVNAGSDAQVKTDVISSVHHQCNKLEFGDEGVATAVSATNPLPTTLGAGGNFVGSVGRKQVAVTTTLTRVASTGSYLANTAITDSASSPTAITFSNVAQSTNGTGVIESVLLISSSNSVTDISLVADFELWLFDTAPTPNNDTSAFSILDGDAVKLVGIVPFKALNVRMGGANFTISGDIPAKGIPFVCVGGVANLYGLLVARSSYSAAASEAFTFRLVIQQN